MKQESVSSFATYVLATCGHTYLASIWAYDALDAAKFIETSLKQRPCDSCLVGMTKLNNMIASAMEGKHDDKDEATA